MRIEVLLFAAAREAARRDSIHVDVDPDARAADVIRAVGLAVPGIADLLPSCRLAIDQCYVSAQESVPETSEVALIPPVSGG
jgi:molybdopterin synthase catalytic subunit/molybdopterin synthase sulfur carrier subunit